jgi:hypothetical protein
MNARVHQRLRGERATCQLKRTKESVRERTAYEESIRKRAACEDTLHARLTIMRREAAAFVNP